MEKTTTVGIDLGGTNIRAGIVKQRKLAALESERINARASLEDVLTQVFNVTDKVFETTVKAIGIGVPGLVDEKNGIVFDVVNIPSWTRLPLREKMEKRYGVPVFINNDANCFALGEYYFGKGADSDAMIGLTIGTGLGTGIVLGGKLYTGTHCGAGEFGMMEYRDRHLEYYASGQFFSNVHGIDGEEVYRRAQQGDEGALKVYEEFGGHLGNAIKIILYALDVDTIIIGGSVRMAWKYYQEAMYAQLNSFAYRKTIDDLVIGISQLENSGILGAAALCFDKI